MLETKKVYKEYRIGGRNLPVLKDISLRVDKGEILAVVGPSGAGKSTLIHILGGLDEPTCGTVYLDGKDMSKLSESELSKIRNIRFGFVFQFYHLLSEFNLLENVIMPALVNKRNRIKDIEKKATGILDLCGLSQRLRHRPSELSGGEQQRVSIARALINSPEILFCDEPTGNLDSETGQQIKNLLWRLNKEEKMAIVLVTHAKELAAGAERVIFIQDGNIVKSIVA
jgi:ABC-type lipoprotein export system ATPase subunit